MAHVVVSWGVPGTHVAVRGAAWQICVLSPDFNVTWRAGLVWCGKILVNESPSKPRQFGEFAGQVQRF